MVVMPTYLYKFLDTGTTIEVQQSFTDDALTEAINPADGLMHPVKKVFTPVGVTFKGGGFYKNDARGSSSTTTPSSSSESPASSSTSPSSDSSSSSTSAASTASSTPTPAPAKAASSSAD